MTKFIGVALVAAVLMIGAVGFLMAPITGGGVKAGFIMNKATNAAGVTIGWGGVKFIMIPSADYPTSGPRFPTNSPFPTSRTSATKLKIW